MTGPVAFLTTFLACLAAIALAFLLWLASSGAARAHDALPTATQPLGWTYGYECCSMTDCRRALAGEISVDPKGYRVNPTGEIIPYGDNRLKRSRDEYYHRCSPNADFKNPRSICLYVPDTSF